MPLRRRRYAEIMAAAGLAESKLEGERVKAQRDVENTRAWTGALSTLVPELAKAGVAVHGGIVDDQMRKAGETVKANAGLRGDEDASKTFRGIDPEKGPQARIGYTQDQQKLARDVVAKREDLQPLKPRNWFDSLTKDYQDSVRAQGRSAAEAGLAESISKTRSAYETSELKAQEGSYKFQGERDDRTRKVSDDGRKEHDHQLGQLKAALVEPVHKSVVAGKAGDAELDRALSDLAARFPGVTDDELRGIAKQIEAERRGVLTKEAREKAADGRAARAEKRAENAQAEAARHAKRMEDIAADRVQASRDIADKRAEAKGRRPLAPKDAKALAQEAKDIATLREIVTEAKAIKARTGLSGPFDGPLNTFGQGVGLDDQELTKWRGKLADLVNRWRHDTFGASLTVPEKKAFAEAIGSTNWTGDDAMIELLEAKLADVERSAKANTYAMDRALVGGLDPSLTPERIIEHLLGAPTAAEQAADAADAASAPPDEMDRDAEMFR